MYVDALLLVSDAQVFGAAAVSTNSIDIGSIAPGRQIGTGEPMGFGLVIDSPGTVAPTLFEIISATDGALTTGIVVEASMSIPLAAALAGATFFLGLPMGKPTQKYLGIRLTTAGGTITATSWLTLASMFSILTRYYPKGYSN